MDDGWEGRKELFKELLFCKFDEQQSLKLNESSMTAARNVRHVFVLETMYLLLTSIFSPYHLNVVSPRSSTLPTSLTRLTQMTMQSHSSWRRTRPPSFPAPSSPSRSAATAAKTATVALVTAKVVKEEPPLSSAEVFSASLPPSRTSTWRWKVGVLT